MESDFKCRCVGAIGYVATCRRIDNVLGVYFQRFQVFRKARQAQLAFEERFGPAWIWGSSIAK